MKEAPPLNIASALALSEASRRIERTEQWEVYTEALARADAAERSLEHMRATIRATREDRRVIARLKAELRQKLDALDALTAARLAKTPNELNAEVLAAERLAWSRRKAGWLANIHDMNAQRDWDRARRGNDSY